LGWTPPCISNTPGTVLPQGLCTGCFSYPPFRGPLPLLPTLTRPLLTVPSNACILLPHTHSLLVFHFSPEHLMDLMLMSAGLVSITPGDRCQGLQVHCCFPTSP
jgi:hypothetical protein